MEHVVFFPAQDGAPVFRRVPTLEEAVRLVEHLRNAEGVVEVSVHPLGAEVPLAFRAYYRVEVPAATGTVAAAPAELAPAPAPVREPVVPEQPRGLEQAVLQQPVLEQAVLQQPVLRQSSVEPVPLLEKPALEHVLGFEEAFGLEQALAPSPAAELGADLFAAPELPAEPGLAVAPAGPASGLEPGGVTSLGFFT